MNAKTNKKTEEKEKTCFIIMPIADMDGYDTGHFNRIYNHLIKPACEKSGFKPVRADDVASSNYIIIDILHKILDSEMVICDLSGRNPNVLYELGIRQAFNLPTVLIKDIKTAKIFDIQGLRYTEYSQSLRVDEVARDTELINKAISQTENCDPKDVNSLIQLLAVKPASRPSSVEISSDTTVILGALKDLATRMSSLETVKKDFSMSSETYTGKWRKSYVPPIIKKLDETTYEINGEKIEIGSELFADGVQIGKLADAHPLGIKIKTVSGSMLQLSTTDSLYSKITDIPF